MENNFFKKIELAAEYIDQRISQSPEVLLILGSGLGDVINETSKQVEISYKEISTCFEVSLITSPKPDPKINRTSGL